MASITNDDVEKLANLSAIAMSDSEIEGFKKQIEGILQYVEKLKNINTDGVKPTTQVTGLSNVMREDLIDTGQVSQEELLKNLPEIQGNLVKVPKVL